jgi:hypothetical protein
LATDASTAKARVASPGAEDRHGAKPVFHRAVTDGRGIGQVLRHAGLQEQALFGAAHGSVDQAIHAASRGLSIGHTT